MIIYTQLKVAMQMIWYHELWHHEGTGFKKYWAVAYWSWTLVIQEDWMRRYHHVHLIYVKMKTCPWSNSCPQAVLLPLTGTSRYADSQQEPSILSILSYPPSSTTLRLPRTLRLSSAQDGHFFNHMFPPSSFIQNADNRLSNHPQSAVTTSSSHQLDTVPQAN